jgi:hypothetical protein
VWAPPKERGTHIRGKLSGAPPPKTPAAMAGREGGMGGVKGWVSKSCFLGDRCWRAFAKIREILSFATCMYLARLPLAPLL